MNESKNDTVIFLMHESVGDAKKIKKRKSRRNPFWAQKSLTSFLRYSFVSPFLLAIFAYHHLWMMLKKVYV